MMKPLVAVALGDPVAPMLAGPQTVVVLAVQNVVKGAVQPTSERDQVVPSHLAMRVAATPPALEKSPAT